MQIVRGGKVSRLHDLIVFRGKTFAIVQQFETPCNRKAKNSLENLRDWRLIHENRESFPPRTICIIRYMLGICTNMHMDCFFPSQSFYHAYVQMWLQLYVCVYSQLVAKAYIYIAIYIQYMPIAIPVLKVCAYD